MTLRAWFAACLLSPAGLALSGCTTNPATGTQSFTAFMSPQEEIRVGREEHPKILREFGGEVHDPAIRRYVSEIGGSLARHSELPGLPFTFTVLNSDIVNAFALPGGYVYVTRGLLALASSEAELAGVLGHEIGHITARHTAQRYSAALAANLAVGILGAVTGSNLWGQVGQTVAELALAGYSREQEFEADTLGVRYLARGHYDTGAMSAFLAKLEANSALEAELAGRLDAGRFDIMQSHPRTAERVREAIQAGRGQAPAEPRVGDDDYLSAIDGLYWGGDPAIGFVRDRTFVHPALRFQFEVPPGFRLVNGERRVVARGPAGARIVFDRDAGERAANLGMVSYLQGVWARDAGLAGVERLDLNGFEAATGATRAATRDGSSELRLIAIRFDPRTVYRFMFVTPVNRSGEFNLAFRRTTYSFRALSEREAATLKPLRIRVVRFGSGDTSESLARRMAVDTVPLRRFETLNGLAPGERPRPGQRVKIIADH
ncbi:MAG: M48 family metalloprotease [Pseudomonadota bacterium]